MHRIHNIIQLAINDSDFKFYIQRQNYQQLYADIRLFIGGCKFRVLVIIQLSYFISYKLYAGPQLENEIYLEYHLTSNKCISVIR